ncbi:hypothetical protein [Hydrogenophaga sp. PBL-H3]|uniref:hypothetical protein n=1 Tax=Hydrogenophaga sp. PBL-H3 TaxID=434010 RepID=UPI00131F97AC|nr:hypothetical protein [Hydrogenophaga sp. PBL-H3]QHE76529.1 hypothetical protein F9Z45_10890 [Hydrogenophaga sp. PBL-H3]QHE80953.1 hypothetical protein F9Z44_10890 [Hydrogenophaga sp. PBL-H3]
MSRVLGGALVCLLVLLSSVTRAQPMAAPATPQAPHVSALMGELEIDRIIEVQVDRLADWNLAIGGPAATRTGPASVHPAWQLVPYIDGRALTGVTPLAVDLGQGRLQFHLRITAQNRDTWTHLLSPLTFQRAVQFSVGLEQVDPFATDFTRTSRRALLTVINWRWLLAAVLIVATFSAAFCALAVHTTLLMERYKLLDGTLAHRFSLAKVQLALWFFVIFSAFLVIWLATGNFDTLNSSILSTLSISAGTALGDTFVKAAGPITATGTLQSGDTDGFLAPRWTARRFMRELVSDDEGCSIARFQMLAWTVALVIVFLADVLDDLQMPVFGPELLYLLGLSTGTYVAHRLPEIQRDRQRNDAAAQT